MNAPQMLQLASMFNIFVKVMHFFICFFWKREQEFLQVPLQTVACSLQQSGMLSCTVFASRPERAICLSCYFLIYPTSV